MPEDTSKGTRREESQKELKRVVGLIYEIDYIMTLRKAPGDQKLKQKLKTIRPGLMERSLKYDKVMKNIEDDEVAYEFIHIDRNYWLSVQHRRDLGR